ncbi:hypothetical protein FA15DRAFT_671648 [Coprinopsis marcescibilis]|uniref:DUF4050 domain-containing protein n=1 Tax=Coprinopsis marcescibilis TaxID=230819 RepID=A0A5C3KPB5_COPMA|nr:hypothetical protein FA15DRAFT_671648 [Coprinopsis marcescibilis]
MIVSGSFFSSPRKSSSSSRALSRSQRLQSSSTANDSNSSATTAPRSRFDELLAKSDLPPPGPALYAARRQLWLSPGWERARQPKPQSSSRQKLELVLNQPNLLHNQEAWKKVDRVWRNLSNGSRLNEGLPMNQIIRIVHAAWIRDGLWPAGLIVLASDDEVLPEGSTSVQTTPLQSEAPEGVTELQVV